MCTLLCRLIEVGEEFCGSKSEDLQNSIKKQSSNYFRNYHRDSLEELRIFLENESWELCPVKPDFSILQLQVCDAVAANISAQVRSMLQFLILFFCCRSSVHYDMCSRAGSLEVMVVRQLSAVPTVAAVITHKMVVPLLEATLHVTQKVGVHLT